MQQIYYNHLKLLMSNTTTTNLNNYIGCCNDMSWPQDGTVALPVNPQGRFLSDEQEKTLKKSQIPPEETMKDKVVKA